VKQLKIKDLGTVITGKTPPTSQDRFFGEGYPFITPSDISTYDVRHLANVERSLTEEWAHQQPRYLLPVHSVCYVCIGSTVGKICMTNKPSFSNQQINTIVCDGSFNPFYVFYKLRIETPKIQSIANGRGSGKPIINKSEFEGLDIVLHEPKEQAKIASILSAYDDLIENNNRRIKILEEMAQAIYNEWFVKFRFPGHSKVKVVDSELGKIPEGWEAVKVGDVIEGIESGSRPKGGIDPEEKGIPSIGAENILGLGQYDFEKEKYVSREFFENMSRGIIKGGDVLLYKDGAKIGRKSMFKDGFPHEVCCINEHVFILRVNNTCSQNYLYFYFDRPDMTQKIIGLNANAAQPGINQAGVKGLPFLLPNKEMVDLFDAQAEPLLGLLFNLARKNKILREKRDILLPRLISGEIDVEDMDIDIGDVNDR